MSKPLSLYAGQTPVTEKAVCGVYRARANQGEDREASGQGSDPPGGDRRE